MSDPQYDLEAMKREKDEADERNRQRSVMGSIGDNLGSRQSFGNFFLGKMNQKSTSGRDLASNLEEKIEDPQTRISKLMANYRAQKEGKLTDMKLAEAEGALDANSSSNVNARMLREKADPSLRKGFDDKTWAGLRAKDFEESDKVRAQQATLENYRTQKAIALAAKNEARQARQYEQDQKRTEKVEKETAEFNVPGLDRTGEVRPSPSDISKLRTRVSDTDSLNKKINRYKELVDKRGSFEWGGTDGTEMESLANDIRLAAKSPSLYDLGVLSGPDLDLIDKSFADPSAFRSILTGTDSRKKQIDTFQNGLNDKLSSSAKSMGYGVPGQKVSNMEAIIDPNGITRMIPSDQVAAALASGGSRPKGSVARGR